MSCSSATALPQAAVTSSFAMIRTLVSVAAASGLLIVLVFQLTAPRIKENKAKALSAAVFEVVPGASSIKAFKVDENDEVVELVGEDEQAIKYYAGYDEQQELLGVAIDAVGQGFADKLRLLYGYSFEKEAIVGVKVLESKETPGLGDKIEKDKDFVSNFDALDVRLLDDGSTLVNEIEVVKQGKKTDRWQISAITGATISSKAVGTILNESAKAHLPRVVVHESSFAGNE